MSDLPQALQQMAERIATLERRVAALEQNRAAPSPLLSSASQPAPRAPALSPSLVPESGVFSILGKAMLAIAGAYLLRALTASSALPRAPLLVLAFAYAFLWLIPATRTRLASASIAWAGVSAIILLPMLWELTLRFGFLTDSLAAAILAAYVIAASALAWKRHFAPVAWIAEGAASLAAVALALAVHDLLPYLAALLTIAAAGEIAAGRNRTLRVRPVVAAASDFLVFALLWIYSSPASSRAEYPGAAPALLLAAAPCLLFIYAGSASTQTLLLGRRISFFETAQTLIAFLLTVWGVLAFWSGPGQHLLGLLCMAAAAAGYAIAFTGFGRASSPRNFHVYASGSLALLLAGCWLAFSPPTLPLLLTAFAALATLLAVRAASRTLEIHALACLFAAACSSGLCIWTMRALAGRFPPSPAWTIDLVAAAAMLSYAAVSAQRGSTHRFLHALRLLQAALPLAAAASLLVWGLVNVTSGAAPAPQRLALFRTLAGCALTVLLAWAGSRQHRRELVWLAWISLASIAGKLLFEDLRHGHLGFTAASIFVYAVTVLAMPRLVRLRPRAQKHA